MKTLTKIALVASVLAASAASAQELKSNDVCAALLCMSTLSTDSAPHECKKYVEPYFEIRVYHRGTFSTKFDPAGTFKKRRETLDEQCPQARDIDRERVNAKFGALEFSPFQF